MRSHWEILLMFVLGCGLAYPASRWMHYRPLYTPLFRTLAWHKRRDWKKGYVRNNSKRNRRLSLLVLITVLVAFPLMYNDDFANRFDLFEYYFVLATLHATAPVILIWTIRSIAIGYQFAKAKLIPEQLPIRRGVQVKARIELNTKLSAEVTDVEVVVSCFEFWWGSRYGWRNEIFSDKKTVCPTHSPTGSFLTFTIFIPKSCPTLTTGARKARVYWVVRVRDLPKGRVLNLDFDLPVFG